MRAILTFTLCLLPAAALAGAATKATVYHVTPAEAWPGDLRLVAAVDDAWTEDKLVARYRRAGSPAGARYQEIPFERSSAGGYYATIPAAAIARPGVEYYIAGVSAAGGGEVDHFASAAWPHEVRVEPPASLRWTEAERTRLGGRLARFRARAEALNFGESDGTDYFFRGEVDWTHRLVTTLYSFTLGYGFIQGPTPGGRDPDPDDPSIDHGLRYGYGEVRIRARHNVWVDAGALMGFSHGGFSAGVRAQLTLGKEWRSCVQIGGEAIQDLDGSAWLRLQWDTVPPFLMGAQVKETRLPGSRVGSGTVLTYDLTYPVSRRISLTATVSYAARSQRRGFLGAGLGGAIEF